jgi:hypothetical protein
VRDASASTPSARLSITRRGHFVAHPEFAVEPVRQVQHEAAAERRRVGQKSRMLPRSRHPDIVYIQDEADGAGGRHQIGMRLVRGRNRSVDEA